MVRPMIDASQLLLNLTAFTPGRTRAPAEVWRGMAELAPLHGVGATPRALRAKNVAF